MNMEVEKLIEDNQRLVISIANFLYRKNRVFSKEDLIQVGFLALCKNGHKYDPARGKVSTFITHCVKNDMIKFIKSNKINNMNLIDYNGFDCARKHESVILDVDDYVTVSEIEKSVVKMKQEGESNKNIASKLKVNPNRISKILSTIRKRVEKQNV